MFRHVNCVSKDGGWSTWGSWGNCSVSCGGGISRRYRHCDNPLPSDMGRPCTGTDEQADVCNTHLCDDAYTHLTGITGMYDLSNITV